MNTSRQMQGHSDLPVTGRSRDLKVPLCHLIALAADEKQSSCNGLKKKKKRNRFVLTSLFWQCVMQVFITLVLNHSNIQALIWHYYMFKCDIFYLNLIKKQ